MRRIRSPWALAALVLALALGVRYAHLAGLRRGYEGTQLFATARLDAAHHMREAEEILERDFRLPDRVPWKGPGYSYFLAGLIALLGRHPDRFRWVVAAIGAANCAALVLVARPMIGTRGAAIAGVVTALHGTLVIYDGELYFPTLLVALGLPVFSLLTLEPPGPWRHAAAGLLLGLAVLVHPVFLIVAAAVAGWLATKGPWRAGPFALALLGAIAPVTLHNVALGQPVLVSWNGGINLYVGNQPGYDQTSGMGTEAWDRVEQSLPDAGISGEAARDRVYYRLAIAEAISRPAKTLAILAEKARILLAPHEISNNFRIYETRAYSPVARALLGRAGPLELPFVLWAPLAWIGAAILARRRAPGHGLLLAWSAGIALSCIVFFNTARYRLPLVFFGTVWVAAAIDEGWRLWTERRRSRLAVGAAVAIAILALTAAIDREQTSLPPPASYTEAQVLESEGRVAEAGRLFDAVAAEHADDTGLLLEAALFHSRHRNGARARSYASAVLARPGVSPDDRANAGEILAESFLADGLLEEARRAFEAAIAVNVDDATWRGYPYFRLGLGPVTACRLEVGLADVALREGRYDEARTLLAGVQSRCGFHGRIRVRFDRLEPLLRGAPAGTAPDTQRNR